jgi:NhaP-type Na+/H+ or K+/H+ antiporter
MEFIVVCAFCFIIFSVVCAGMWAALVAIYFHGYRRDGYHVGDAFNIAIRKLK